jgi:hypothetical protein
MQTAQRKSFPVYTSWKKPLEKMSLEEKGMVLENLMRYHSDEQLLEMTDKVEMFWDTIEYNLEENNKKYQAKVDNMKNVSKTNSKLQNTQYRELKDPILDTLRPDIGSQNTRLWVSNDNDNVNDNVNVKENENENENVNEICRMLEINVNEWNSISPGKKRQYIESYNYRKNK